MAGTKQNFGPTKSGGTRVGGEIAAGNAGTGRKASIAVGGSIGSGYGEANEKLGSQYKQAAKSNDQKFKPTTGKGNVR